MRETLHYSLHNIRNVLPCMPWLVFEILATLLVEFAAEVIIILRGTSPPRSSKVASDGRTETPYHLNALPPRADLRNSCHVPVYAIYATKTRVLRVMLVGFALQVILMGVSLGVSMPKIMAGFYCKAADLPAEMVLYR